MPEMYAVRFVSTDTGIKTEDDFYLQHYGIKGQKWGLRRFQNEDGSYTNEGLARLQRGMERIRGFGSRAQSTYNSVRSTAKKVKTAASNPKQAVKNMLGSSQKPKGTAAQQKARRDKAKKIMIAAGAVALTAAAAYGIHRHNKTSENITQMARNSIAKRYDDAIKNNTGAKLRELQLMKQKEMADVGIRKNAYKELGLRRRSQARQFIRDNKVYKKKLVDLVRERHDFSNIKGMRKSKLTGKWRSLNKRELARAYKQTARYLRDI